MSDTLKTILSRRSIRAYREEQIKDHELDAILEAGKFAPSAMNQQSWHFTVIQSRDVLQRIDKLAKALYEKSGNKVFEERAKAENFSAFYNAPTYIIVSGDEKAIAPKIDGALALGNMFLAAEAQGISSCWIHMVNFMYGTEEGKALLKDLGIPEGYAPVGSGVFGYKSSEAPAPAPRKEGTVNIIK